MELLELRSDEELWDFIAYSLVREEINEGYPGNPGSMFAFLANSKFCRIKHNMFIAPDSDDDFDMKSDFRGYFVLNYSINEKKVLDEKKLLWAEATKGMSNTREVGNDVSKVYTKSCTNTALTMSGTLAQEIAKAYNAHGKYQVGYGNSIANMIGGAASYFFGGGADVASGAAAIWGGGNALDYIEPAYRAVPYSEEVYFLNIIGFSTIVNNRRNIILSRR